MASKKKRDRNRGKRRAGTGYRKAKRKSDTPASPSEKKMVEVLTVGLVLAAMATLMAEFAVAGVRVVMLVIPELRTSESLDAGAWLMLMVAAVTGGICLILTPIVSRTRKARLPLTVTAGITIAAVAPYVTIIATAWR